MPIDPRSLEGARWSQIRPNNSDLSRQPSPQEGIPTESLASRDYWESMWNRIRPKYSTDLAFRDLFDRYLKRGGTCFEIGCYPGRFLAYLCKTFDYEANGIDTTPFVVTRLPQFLRSNGVQVGELVEGDFFKHRFTRRYDVVCSFGFLEHFTDYPSVIRKHAEIVNDGGTLILTCPNFRGAQHLLRRLLDPEDLKRHVLPSMDFRAWTSILSAAGMNVIFQGYYRTLGFWTSYQSEDSARGELARIMGFVSAGVNKYVNLPNPVTSPHMISISRKRGSSRQRRDTSVS